MELSGRKNLPGYAEVKFLIESEWQVLDDDNI